MDSAIISKIIETGGIMGAVYLITMVPLALYAKKQAQELKEVQDRRAVDAQQTVDKLLTLNDKWNATVAEQIRTVEAIDTSMADLRSAINEIRTLMMSNRRT
jgi:hypothetical protein